MVVDSRNRGQLILIGAIAVALLVIGVSLAVNAVLFTENVRPAESTSQLGEAQEIDFEARRSVRSLAIRVNHRTRNHTKPQIATWVESNVTQMSHFLEESYVTSTPTAVNISYNLGAGTNGSRLVQLGDDTFEDGFATDWDPVGPAKPDPVTGWPDGDPHRLGWAVINLNASQSSKGRFHANFSNAQGEHVNMTFNKTTGPVEYEVITSSSAGSGARTEVTCTPQDEQVLLNLYDGRSFTDNQCVFNGSTEIQNVTRVHFEGADNAIGRYAFVVNESDRLAINNPCTSTASPSAPCYTPVVWRSNITVGITGEGFQYVNRHNVSIYTGGS